MKRLIAASAGALLLAVAAASPSAAAQLVTNGGFDSGLAGWTVNNQVLALDAQDYASCCGVFGSEPNYSTNKFASFGAGNVTGIHTLSQSFTTVAGSLYNLTFDAGAFGGGVNTLMLSIAGLSNAYSLFSDNNADTTFHPYGFSFVGTGSDTLTFSVNTVADNVDGLLDNVSVTGLAAVPEPATWAMMLVGFFGMGSLLRSRRKAGLAFAA